jgi:hypothetical protein
MSETGSNMIVAGRSIGQTELGSNGAVYLAKLGEPDARDDAPGRYTSIWVSTKRGENKDTLFIYSVRNEDRNLEPIDGVSILAIRVTSSWFRTSDGVSTGYTLGQILDRRLLTKQAVVHYARPLYFLPQPKLHFLQFTPSAVPALVKNLPDRPELRQ